MRKLLLVLAVLLTFSLAGFAQAASGQAGTETTTKTKTEKKTKTSKGEPKESQLTGCLAKDAAGTGYVLTNGRHKKGVEVTSSEDLSAHVGHEVKLMGTWEKPSTGEKMHKFNATSLTHISDTCTAAATGGKKGGKKAAPEKAPGF